MSAAKNNDMDNMFGGSEQIKRSKRAKIILILVIVVLLVALGALGYLWVKVFNESQDNDRPVIGSSSTTTITDTPVSDIEAPGTVEIETTTIPNLATLFGLTAEEVAGRLGAEFQLKSSTPTTDNTNANIKQLATFVYTPHVSGDTTATANATLPVESVYASLDEGGRVVDIYYSCDMKLLGYQEEAFDTIVTENLVREALAAAGVEPRDFIFASPGEESIVYDNKESANRKVVKQTQIYSGRTTSDTNPTAWTFTVTYDFGISGVASTGDFREATRTINLKLA